MKLRDILEEDYKRYKKYSGRVSTWRFIKAYFDTLSETRTLSYVITMRICNILDRKGHRILLQPFRFRLRQLQLKFGIEISYKSNIGEGFHIAHGNGIVVHPNTIIGRQCSILQQVTIGNNVAKSRNEVATIGDYVYIGAGAKIIGPITIGDHVVIGANSVVTKDAESNTIIAGVPAIRIG